MVTMIIILILLYSFVDEDVFDYLNDIDENVESYDIYEDDVRIDVENRLRNEMEHISKTS